MTDFLNTNLGKTIKAALFIAVSSAISYLVTAIAGSPELFGPVTPLVNIVLVLVQKTWFSPKTPNVGV